MKYRFEEITINSTEKKKPTPADKDVYLGLEHLDSDNLAVTRFGSEVAPIGEKLIIKKGDVLFGKRRAYQKKVAVAPFDGIFSAHGMVLRPKAAVVDSSFFPLFISSDYFLDAAIKISVGSLSPTINWRDLKELTFDLPPLTEQRKLAGLLWAANDAREAYKKLLTSTDELVKSQFVEMFGDPVTNPMGWELSTLKNVTMEKLSYGSGAAATKYDNDVRYVRITDIIDNGELNNDIVSPSEYDEKYLLRDGDILFARSGATVGKTFRYSEKWGKCIFAGYLIRLVPNISKVLPDYVFAFTKTNYYQEFVKINQRTVAQPNINAQQYGDLTICVPPLPLQARFAGFVRAADKSKFALQRSIDELEATYKSLLRENLG